MSLIIKMNISIISQAQRTAREKPDSRVQCSHAVDTVVAVGRQRSLLWSHADILCFSRSVFFVFQLFPSNNVHFKDYLKHSSSMYGADANIKMRIWKRMQNW